MPAARPRLFAPLPAPGPPSRGRTSRRSPSPGGREKPRRAGQVYRHPEKGAGGETEPHPTSPGAEGLSPSPGRAGAEGAGTGFGGGGRLAPLTPHLTSEPVSAGAQEPQGAAAHRVALPLSRGPLPAGSLGVAPGSPPAAASLPHGAGPAGDLPAGRVRRAPAAAPGAGARRLVLLLPGLERRRLFVPASGRDDHLRIVPAGAGAPRRTEGGRGGEARRGGTVLSEELPPPPGRARRPRGGDGGGGLVVTGWRGAAGHYSSGLRRHCRLLRPVGHVGAGAALSGGAGNGSPRPPPPSALRPVAHARAAPEPGGRAEPLLPLPSPLPPPPTASEPHVLPGPRAGLRGLRLGPLSEEAGAGLFSLTSHLRGGRRFCKQRLR